MKRKKNTYLLLDIFNAIVEICYMIAINYNDLIIEEYLKVSKNSWDSFVFGNFLELNLYNYIEDKNSGKNSINGTTSKDKKSEND